MAIAKVIYKTNPNDSGTVWIDATPATATASDILAPKTAMLADGVVTTGTGTGGGGGGGVEESDVNFIDYNGDLLYSYTKADFANLSAMPANPSHTDMGLSAQGWNWSLADAKTYVASYDKLWIGQQYDTVSGWTEIDVEFDDANYTSPYLKYAVNGTIQIDWGDGSAVETDTGTSLTSVKYKQHTWSQINTKYTVKVKATSGKFRFYTSGSSPSIFSVEATTTNSRFYSQNITAIRLSATSGLGNFDSMAYCVNAEYIIIPPNTGLTTAPSVEYGYRLKGLVYPTGITSMARVGSSSVARLSLPAGVTSFPNNALYHVGFLTSVSIPSTVTTINSNAIYNTGIRELDIPSSVTTIGGNAICNNDCLKKIKFHNQTISPATGATSLFASNYMLKKIEGLNFGNAVSLPTQTFYSNYALRELTLPSKLTAIPNSFLQSAYSLRTITIPEDVTSIGTQAFSGCYSLMEMQFNPATPPTASNSNWYSNLPTTCTLYVPVSAIYAYTNATNYPSKSTYTYIGFATYANGATLPSTDTTSNYNLVWYASKEDAINETSAISTGNGSEVYCRYTAI